MQDHLIQHLVFHVIISELTVSHKTHYDELFQVFVSCQLDHHMYVRRYT